MVAAMARGQALHMQLRGLFVHQAPCTILGWVWKAALVLTLEMMLRSRRLRQSFQGAMQEPRNTDDVRVIDVDKRGPGMLWMFFVRLIVYILLLLATAFLARHMGVDTNIARRPWMEPDEVPVPSTLRSHMTLVALAILPAWAFKDVVASFLSSVDLWWMRNLDVKDGPGKYSSIWPASVMAASCVVVALLPTARTGFLQRNVLGRMPDSIALGVAYSTNMLFKEWAWSFWTTLPFQAAYVALATLAAAMARPRLLGLVEALDARRIQGGKERRFARKMIFFTMLVVGYISMWSWNSLILAVLTLWPTPEPQQVWEAFHRRLWCAVIVTAAGVMYVVVTPTCGALKKRIGTAAELTVLVVGTNIGSMWCDVISALFDACDGGYGFAWLLVFEITVLVPLAAFCIHLSLELLFGDDFTEEEETQLQEPPDHLTSNSAFGSEMALQNFGADSTLSFSSFSSSMAHWPRARKSSYLPTIHSEPASSSTESVPRQLSPISSHGSIESNSSSSRRFLQVPASCPAMPAAMDWTTTSQPSLQPQSQLRPPQAKTFPTLSPDRAAQPDGSFVGNGEASGVFEIETGKG